METLGEYKNRIYGFMKKEMSEEVFCTNTSLNRKVSGEGEFLTFVGDTVVFLLDDIKDILQKYQDMLYAECYGMLAERINAETFHVTLHDLSNGQPSEELRRLQQQNSFKTRQMLEAFLQKYNEKIQLRPVSVFNMVNTSLVLGLEPADDRSCQCLMEMYDKLQQVVELHTPLTLHITLAYFRPGTYGTDTVNKLKEAIRQINTKKAPLFELKMRQLKYQRFDDMNHYYNVEE